MITFNIYKKPRLNSQDIPRDQNNLRSSLLRCLPRIPPAVWTGRSSSRFRKLNPPSPSKVKRRNNRKLSSLSSSEGLWCKFASLLPKLRFWMSHSITRSALSSNHKEFSNSPNSFLSLRPILLRHMRCEKKYSSNSFGTSMAFFEHRYSFHKAPIKLLKSTLSPSLMK